MKILIVFTIFAFFVSLSQQQRIRPNLQATRNLANNDLVQRYEDTPPIKPIRKPAPPAPRAEVQRPPKPKIERKLFNVLLRTPSGFDETAGYAITT